MSCNTSSSDQDSRDPGSSSTGLSAVDGDATSLFEYIIRDKVWGANLDPPESAKNVIKPWHERLSADPSTQSNVDDQLAITVPFTCPVRLKSILINTGTGDFAPTRCRAFVNRPDGVDFDDVEQATADDHPANLSPLASAATLGNVGSGKAQADFALLRGQEGVVEYPVSVARFSHTNSITIVLSHSNATTLSKFFYLGFRGTALVLKSEPGERLNIGAANSADRPVDGLKEKRGASQGLAGGSGRRNSSPRYVVGDQQVAQRIAQIAEDANTTPRRSPRRSRVSTPGGTAPDTESPTTTPTRKRKARASQAGEGDDDTETTPRPSRSPAKTRAPNTAPAVRNRPSMAGASPSAAASSLRGRDASQAQTASSSDPTRRRSLSQPPPNDVLLRQLQSSSMTPSAKYAAAQKQARTPSQTAALTTTPGRRALGTPRRTVPSSASAATNPFTGAASSSQQGMQTPATDKRRKRNDALLASAQRTRERRSASRKSLLWGGVGGWAGGREESPMDLLRRLARAPDFVAPPTPSEDSIAMPPPGVRPGRTSTASTADASSSRTRARDSAASSSHRSNVLMPGVSVPGDLTRDSNVSESLDVDESLMSPDDRSRSRLSDMGIPRRASGVGLVRGGIFAGMADRPKTSRISTGSRVSFAEQPSPASMRFDDMSSRREDELEHSLQQRGGAESFISASGIDAATARAIRRLDDLTRQSFFSEDGQLQYDDEDDEDEEEDAAILEARRRKSMGRSMSEPLEGEADGSILFLGGDDDMSQIHGDEEDQVSDSLAVDAADDDSDGLARRLAADDSASRDLSIQRDTSITGGEGDDSRISRVSFAEQEDVSFQVDDAYSSDDGAVEYGLSVPDLEEDDDSDAENRDARLDLLDPKDINALLKRRIVKKRKLRVSPHTGESVPPLPASVMRDIFSSFLTPSSSGTSSSLLSSSGSSTKKAKLDSTVLDELDSACHDFFADFAANLLTQAKTRSSRRAAEGVNITEQDVVAVLKRQGRVTQRHDASSLAHKLLPRELTDQMELSRWAKAGTVQTTLSGMFAGRAQQAEQEASSFETESSESR
ncbi:PITH domain protein [Kalmanozyma brasiliensis GHG001]|uniref:PITH domain protein n=1 Tax=Kalmanozyma brasiliensis (strain GHG001) TaxID=1365824 RepID=UPI001CE9C424|nr:PITH domain protein [Kalmanozyma brasiliensis GHG001]EST06777.2 PITH domain protein [Kalmanozyma brasiliensis GHG001]